MPGELVCAHSQVKRINSGPACGRKANWGKRAGRQLGGADARGAGSRGSGAGVPSARAPLSVIFPRRRGPARSIFPGNPQPEHHRSLLNQGRVLRFTWRLLAASAEALEDPSPASSAPGTLCPRPGGVRGPEPPDSRAFGRQLPVSPHRRRRRRRTCSARADGAEARI